MNLRHKEKYLIKKTLHSVGDMVKDHNKAMVVSVTTNFMHLSPNDDGLVELEVKASATELGVLYRKTVDFLTYGGIDDKLVMIHFEPLAKVVEAYVKKYGKVFSNEPLAYHLRRFEDGRVVYYLKDEDIYSLYEHEQEIEKL